jgi:predicted unusual protein kinase regulating ubiquinone biosynthesis (AarF/ABC1/UbiB family)
MSYAITRRVIIPTYSMKLQEVPKKNNVVNTVTFFVNYVAKSKFKMNQKEFANWTKTQLIDLGPTFIKMGQFISTRSDIFDKPTIDELKTLQDNAPPFSADLAKAIISEELGRPYNEIFKDFEDIPLASASISQVHKARLISNNKDVVIKVQRPYIRDYFDRDFTTLRTIFSFAEIFNDRSVADSKLLLDDCYKYLYEELSFENELENIKTFQKILKSNTEIIVPRAYRKYSTGKIITMEYIESKKIGFDSTGNANKELLASLLMECFIKQILEHGIIHADPHPGNVGITNDGKIVLYDFGQVVKLDEAFTKSVKSLLFAVYERDVDNIVNLLLKTKAIVLTRPMDKAAINGFVEQIVKYFENVDFKAFQLSMIESDIGIDLPFKFNPNLIMMFRSLSLLEGICKELDPEFSYFKVIDLLMSDVFLDMDYIDHRARKDLLSLFDTTTNSPQMETFQNTIQENNKKYMNTVNSTLKEYQKIFIILMLFNIWDIDNVPKSVALLGTFIYLIVRVKK